MVCRQAGTSDQEVLLRRINMKAMGQVTLPVVVEYRVCSRPDKTHLTSGYAPLHQNARCKMALVPERGGGFKGQGRKSI